MPRRAQNGPRRSGAQESALRVVYITEWFLPEADGAPAWIAEALRDRGAQVGVVTGAPHYPGGRVFPGYRATGWIRETQRGLPVVRVPEYPSHDTSAVRRIATFSSFALSATALAKNTIGGADVALVYSSPATSALPAMVARRRYGIPYVLFVQDLWPDAVFSSGFVGEGRIARAMRQSLEAFVARTYRDAAHIAAIAPGMRTRLIERGVPAEKVSVVFNWAVESVLRPVAPNGRLRGLLGLGAEDVLVVHAGNQGEAQALDHWVDAMARLADLPHLHLVLLGTGTQHENLRRQVADRDLARRVHFLPPVPIGEVAEHTADADALAVSLRDDPLCAITLPSKTQAALAQGKPLVVCAAGDAASVVAEAGAGWVARPDDVESLAAALQALARSAPQARRHCGQAGLAYYQTHMSEKVGGDELYAILRRVARRLNGTHPRASGCTIADLGVGGGRYLWPPATHACDVAEIPEHGLSQIRVNRSMQVRRLPVPVCRL